MAEHKKQVVESPPSYTPDEEVTMTDVLIHENQGKWYEFAKSDGEGKFVAQVAQVGPGQIVPMGVSGNRRFDRQDVPELTDEIKVVRPLNAIIELRPVE